MGSSNKFKRELLRGAVEQNIETLADRPLGTTRRERDRRRLMLRRVMLSTSLVAVVAVTVTAWFAASPDSDSVGPAGPATRLVAGRSAPPITRMSTPEEVAEKLSMQQPEALVRNVIPLAIQRVAIDPGHGGRDGGTSVKYGLLEKDLTRDIADRLARHLEEISIEVVMTRAGDEAVSLKDRAMRANVSGADLFVSIHVNWLPNRNARGVETYYLGTTDDPFLNRLAASENRDSGYAMADVRRLLEGIYADVREAESEKLASAVQLSLFDTLKQANDRIVSRGVLQAPFVVLMATEMPAILAEVACLSNDHEARLLAVPDYRQRIADALFTGITDYAQGIGQTADALVEKGPENG